MEKEKTNVVSILTLAGEFTSYGELEAYSNKQFILLDKSTKKVKELEEEVEHLKSLLFNTTQLIEKEMSKGIIVSPEEALCMGQISILEERGRGQTELTLEEIKKFDLLMKNLNSIRDTETVKKQIKTFTSVASDRDLLKLASEDKENI